MGIKIRGASGAAEARVFHTLDALRGIAAIGVVVFHMQGMFMPIAAPGGYLAVDLFFMMSGVVLSHAYEARFRAGLGTLDFMRVRLIRLYPLYLLGTFLGIAVTVASLLGRNIENWDSTSVMEAALLALFFLPNLSENPTNQLFPLNIPCWSLFLEILVNLLFVTFWPLLSSRRLVFITALTGGTIASAILSKGSIDQGSIAAGLAVGIARTLFGFSVGVLIARHVGRRPRGESNLKVLAIVGVAGVALAGWPEGGARAIWDAMCVLIAFPLIVYAGTLVDPGPRMQEIAKFLGVISYAIYVLHSPLSSIVNSASRHFALPRGGAPYLGIIVMIFLCSACWLVDRNFDMPIRRRLSGMFSKLSAFRREN